MATPNPTYSSAPAHALIDLSYFAEYLTFRKSKGIYYTLKESGGTTYFVLDHVLNLSLHGDDKKDTEV